MIEKKDDHPSTPDAESLAQTCHTLEASKLQVQGEVRSLFARLQESLQSRERQLLRQIDVAHSQQLAFVQSRSENAVSERVPNVSFRLDNEKSVTDIISSLGAVGLTGGGLVVLNGDGSFLQRVEDYQDANQDHVSMFKPVPLDQSLSPAQEAVIRFSHISLPQNSPGSSELLELRKSPEEEVMFSENNNSEDNCDAEGSEKACSSQQRHSTQVQQWLKQLSAETETEPSIGEPKNFEPI